MHTMSLRLSNTLAEKLRAEALRENRSLNAHIAYILMNHIDTIVIPNDNDNGNSDTTNGQRRHLRRILNKES